MLSKSEKTVAPPIEDLEPKKDSGFPIFEFSSNPIPKDGSSTVGLRKSFSTPSFSSTSTSKDKKSLGDRKTSRKSRHSSGASSPKSKEVANEIAKELQAYFPTEKNHRSVSPSESLKPTNSQRYVRWRIDDEILSEINAILGPLSEKKRRQVYNVLQCFSVNGLPPNKPLPVASSKKRASAGLLEVASASTTTKPQDLSCNPNGPPQTVNQSFCFANHHDLYNTFYPNSGGSDGSPSPTICDSDSDSDSCDSFHSSTTTILDHDDDAYFSQPQAFNPLPPDDGVEKTRRSPSRSPKMRPFNPPSPALPSPDISLGSGKRKLKEEDDEVQQPLGRSTNPSFGFGMSFVNSLPTTERPIKRVKKTRRGGF